MPHRCAAQAEVEHQCVDGLNWILSARDSAWPWISLSDVCHLCEKFRISFFLSGLTGGVWSHGDIARASRRFPKQWRQGVKEWQHMSKLVNMFLSMTWLLVTDCTFILLYLLCLCIVKMCQRTLEWLWQWTATDSVMRQRFQRLTVSRYCTLLYYLVASAGLDVFKSISSIFGYILHHFACRGAAGHKCERCWVYTTDVGDCEVAWLCTACCMLLRFGLAEHLGVKLVAASIKRLFCEQEHPSLCMRCADVVLEMGVRLSVSVEGSLTVVQVQADFTYTSWRCHRHLRPLLFATELFHLLQILSSNTSDVPWHMSLQMWYMIYVKITRTHTNTVQLIMIAKVRVMLQHVAITDIWTDVQAWWAQSCNAERLSFVKLGRKADRSERSLRNVAFFIPNFRFAQGSST